MVLNARVSPARPSGSDPDIKSQGVYAKKAGNRRAQTLTKEQLDPAKYSATRRGNYTTGGKYIGGS